MLYLDYNVLFYASSSLIFYVMVDLVKLRVCYNNT